MKIFLIVIAVLFTIFFAFSQNENVKKEVYVLIKKIDEIEIKISENSNISEILKSFEIKPINVSNFKML